MCWHVLSEVTPLCEGKGTMGAMKGFYACQLDCKSSCTVNKQTGEFGYRVAALIAIVIFLCIRLDLVDFGHLGKF